MICVQYARFSPRPEETDTIEVQAAIIERYCDYMQMSPQALFIDKQTSARKVAFRNRKGGAALLAYIAEHDIRHIVVKSLDRMFRNVIDGLTQLDRWAKLKICLHDAAGGTSLSVQKAQGRLIVTTLLSLAEYEPTVTAERTSDAMQHHQRNGRRQTPKNKIPFGTMLDPDDHKRIIVSNAEVAMSETVAQLRIEGMSYREIAHEMNINGFTYRGKEWNYGRVRRTLDSVAEERIVACV